MPAVWKAVSAERNAYDRHCKTAYPPRPIGMFRPKTFWQIRTASAELLLCSENCVPCRLGDSEFKHGFGWNPDLLLRAGIKSCARLSLLFDQLAKAGQNEFAVLFDRFVSEDAQRIEEYSSGLLIGLGCFGKCDLQFCLGNL